MKCAQMLRCGDQSSCVESQIRQLAEISAKQPGSTLREDARILRAAADLEVHSDTTVWAVVKFRAVFAGTTTGRQEVKPRMQEVFRSRAGTGARK